MNKWSLEEFIELLNKTMPLNELKATDKRRTNSWNARLLRNYVSEKKISLPFKTGRNAFYTDKHLEEVKNLITLQSLGISSKAMPSSIEYAKSPYSKLTAGNYVNGNNADTNFMLSASISNGTTESQTAMALLNNMNLRSFAPVEKEKIWKKVKIGEDIEISISEKHWNKIELIKQEMKKLTGE